MFKSIQKGGFFHRFGWMFHREGTMYERPFYPKVTSLFYSALSDVLRNFMQLMKTVIIVKFKCYGIYALVHPFIDRQPVN